MPADRPPSHARVVVVGAGFSGVAAAVALERSGEHDVVVLEQADEVGGTWRDNAYPGCACDVPSHLYQLSYAPNPDWSHGFARQPEIQRYLVDVARRLGVRDRVRFGTGLERASWDPAAGRWDVTTTRGATDGRRARARPPGRCRSRPCRTCRASTSFAGPAFHSARWDHDADLRGKRVAVVGTGASAVQFVPEVQREALSLTVFQRTPPWVLPRRDRRDHAAREAALPAGAGPAAARAPTHRPGPRELGARVQRPHPDHAGRRAARPRPPRPAGARPPACARR